MAVFKMDGAWTPEISKVGVGGWLQRAPGDPPLGDRSLPGWRLTYRNRPLRVRGYLKSQASFIAKNGPVRVIIFAADRGIQ